MGQTLTNGVYLPDNGERNCYTGLSQNWQKLDNLIGSHSDTVSFSQTLTEGVEIGKITINGVDVSLFHTDYSSDIASKAKASDLTAHTSDTDIHVTTSDKAKWNAKQEALTSQQIQNINDVTNKANDSDVVHMSGNETIGGDKTFTGISEFLRTGGDHKLKIIDTRVTPLDPTKSITSNIVWQDTEGRLLGLIANIYDSSGNSIMQLYARSFNANNEQESHKLRVISNKGGSSYADVDVDFLPYFNGKINLGTSTNKWKTINGIKPGNLSLPCDTYTDDYSNNLVYQDFVNGYNFNAPYDCLITLRSQVFNGNYLIVNSTLNIRSSVSIGYSGVNLFARKNDAIGVYCPSQSVNTGVTLRLFKLKGNV